VEVDSMNARLFRRLAVLLPLLVLIAAALATAQGKITTPKDFVGTDPGDDYFLANYTQLHAYLTKIAQETNRMKLVDIGKTAEGRPMVMAIFTSPENQKNLARYKEISQKLARAEGLTDDQARKLAAEGKAVVWVDGGLHATECVPAQHLFQLVYQMASRTDPETLRFLNDVILLVVPINPDGMELVSNWYMRESDPKKRSMNIPRLYQKYVGHDNNRDSYANNQPETEAVSRQQFIEWNPHIIYNQHQTGPAGTVLFMAPFRDPFNYNYDPLVPEGIELVGAAIHSRFIVEGKPGAVQRGGASYSTWFNGGIRTATYFHNQIGLLSEIIGNPTPISIPFIPTRQLPDGNQPFPIQPQSVWHQRQSIEYLLTADRAIMDIASKDREGFLYRAYVMGRNSIERGNKDTWTITPKKIAAVQAAIAKDMGTQGQAQGGSGDFAGQVGGGLRGGVPAKYYDLLRDPAKRDPRGFILPSDQPDFLTATRFVNALLKSGIVIHRATAPFQVAGKSYPAGSYVVKAAQAFRPHVMDMFEPQDHPDDIPYPGGPPRPPYDATGWTLAYQMGVKFDRVFDGFDGPFERIPDVVKPAAGKVTTAKAAVGYLLSHQQNDAFVATGRLLAAKEDVFWLKSPVTVGATTYPAGTLYVPAKPTTKAVLDKIAADLGMNADAVSARPSGEALKLKPVRVALWDRYGGSMDSGWIRWIFEQAYPTTFDVVYPATLDAGDLNAKYDVIIFPGGSIPAAAGDGGGRRGGGGGGQGGPNPADIPEEFRGRLGNITVDKTIPQLRKFVENGGTIIAIGGGTSIAGHLGLPVSNHLVERQPNGAERRLGNEKFYVPGSVLQVAVDTSSPLAYGLGDKVDVFFDNSPVFRLEPDAALKGVKAVAWFDSPAPLRSGWAWGQNYLDGGAAIVDATVGKGRVFLLGPEVTFRGQPHGTFKFVFNGIYLGSATPANLGTAPKR
jgi:hypothetical protein